MSGQRHCPEPWAPMQHARTGDNKPRVNAGTAYIFGSLVIVIDERTLAIRVLVVAPWQPTTNWRPM